MSVFQVLQTFVCLSVVSEMFTSLLFMTARTIAVIITASALVHFFLSSLVQSPTLNAHMYSIIYVRSLGLFALSLSFLLTHGLIFIFLLQWSCCDARDRNAPGCQPGGNHEPSA